MPLYLPLYCCFHIRDSNHSSYHHTLNVFNQFSTCFEGTILFILASSSEKNFYSQDKQAVASHSQVWEGCKGCPLLFRAGHWQGMIGQTICASASFCSFPQKGIQCTKTLSDITISMDAVPTIAHLKGSVQLANGCLKRQLYPGTEPAHHKTQPLSKGKILFPSTARLFNNTKYQEVLLCFYL